MSLDTRELISEKVKQYKVLLSKDFTAFTVSKVLSDVTHLMYRNIEQAATTGSGGSGSGDIIIDGGTPTSTYTSEVDGGGI